MRYLLDTHVLLWAATLDKKLPKEILDILQNKDFDVSYSVICVWELVIKEAKEKITLPDNFFLELPNLGFNCLSIKEAYIHTLRKIPVNHGDPFDRMLIAQAMTENMTLITCDKKLTDYPVKIFTL
ncbi:MAG: type II toxin-antitoxin system VapC family toxin [Pseudomonadota bacterium]|jgi:PIN domain nuclease of toxin-antitoxin system